MAPSVQSAVNTHLLLLSKNVHHCIDNNSFLLQFKLNTDESPGVAAEYGIRSIPTVMIFKDGTKMDTVIGAVPKTTLTQTLEKYL